MFKSIPYLSLPRSSREMTTDEPGVVVPDEADMSYHVRSRPAQVYSKCLTRMHFYLKLANNNHIGILDVLLTETRLVTMENPGPLPLRSQILQLRAESGTS